jgi:hypothetical protein
MSAKRTLERELARRSASHKLQLASSAEDRDLPHVLEDHFIALADPSVQNLEKRARHDAHWEARAKSEPLKALARNLATFSEDSKAQSRDLLSPLLGDSEVFADCFHRVPAAIAHFDFHLPIDKLASRILSSCSSHSPVHQRFLRELGADWELRNGMVMPSQGEIGKHTVSRCAAAGLCLCSGVGKKAVVMRNAWYLKAFQPHFRQGLPERSLVDTARIVVKMSGHRVAPDGTNVTETHWWSLALQYWSPKRVTFFEFCPSSACDDRGDVVLEATGPIVREFSAFAVLDPACVWSCRFYCMVSSKCPVARVDPRLVSVQPLRPGSPVLQSCIKGQTVWVDMLDSNEVTYLSQAWSRVLLNSTRLQTWQEILISLMLSQCLPLSLGP